MKKHFLFLASLVLGFGQLFADQVTFSLADLRATLPSNNTKVEVPYTWKVSPYHVSVTIAKKDGTTGTLSIANPTTLTNYTLTVNIAGEGSLDGVTVSAPTGVDVLGASNGSYESGTWAPAESGINSVTFTPTGNFRLSSLTVDYTPDSGYTPDVPVTGGDPLVGPFEATPIESLASYTGTDQYVFDMASRKYYALNNLDEYEEFGIYPEVSTLKVAGVSTSHEIEYIATSESEAYANMPYINTNYIPKANTRIVLDVDIANSTAKDWMAVFGARQGGWTSHAFVLFARTVKDGGGNKGCYNRTNDEHVGTTDIPRGQRMTIDASGNTVTFTVNETEAARIEANGTVEDCTNNLYIFDTNTAGAGGNQRDNSYVYMKLYGCKIYEGDELVREFVPIVNADGKGGLKDKVTGEEILSSGSDFTLSPDGQAIVNDAGITVYPGKLVINTNDNHEYNWNGTKWVDLGSVYKPIADSNYQDMRREGKGGGWKCRFGFDDTYNNITNDGNNNFFNPYRGSGGWEPYQCKIQGLTKGETYRVSFNFTSNGWTSWDNGRWIGLPVFVTSNEEFSQNDYYPTSVGGEMLGFVILPKAAATNQAYSFTFTANATDAVLAVNFGVVADDIDYFFHFDDLTIEFVDYPQKYSIDWADPNHYEPLEYIENISAPKEHAYTLPYIPITSTQIGMKFLVNDKTTGWSGIFCGRNWGAGTGISLYMNGDKAHFGYFTGGTTGAGDNFAPFSLNTEYTITADVTKLVVNGTVYNTGNTVTNATTRQLSLFANPENDNPMRGPIYYCTISENGETIYNFKPVMRHDGVYGFYDKASKTFVLPAQGGSLEGYGFATLSDESYIYFPRVARTIFVGFTDNFEPTVQNIETAPAFTWTSSNTEVATVAADGTVTGVARGTVTITATDTNSDWVASYTLTVEPAVVAADKVEVWDGTSDAIVGSIRWNGDSYKSAYTVTFDSGEGFGDWNTSNPKYNVIYGVPEVDENSKAWYEADYQMTNVPGSIWSYNNTVLPNSWPSNPGEVYVRRYFKAEGELPAQLYMPAPHDDAPCEYYINGTQVWSRTGWEPRVVGWYEDEVVKLTADQRALIKTDGSVNVFAYHVHQNWGGRYADGGIYGNSMADNTPSKRFEENDDIKRLPNAVAQAINTNGFPADLLEYFQNEGTNLYTCLQNANYLSMIRWELRKLLAPRHNFDFASAEPTDGGEYWIYNVGAGQFLAGGNDWGTHASLDYQISQWPMVLRANTSGANRFAIQTNLPNGLRGKNDGLGHNGYVDCEYGEDFTTNEGWAWTFEAVGNGNYRIIQSGREAEGGKYLGMVESFTYQVNTDMAGADNLYNQWKLITREQLEALAATATPENPADVSFYITQNSFSQNEFNGNDKGAANADFSEAEAKWERNAGNIGSWKQNESNGDFIFEMWNEAGNRKVYLKQVLEGLPAGQYIVECTGYYRDGSYEDAIAGNARQQAYLYAGSESNNVLLPSILDYANQAAGMGDLGDLTNVIPNSVGQASRFFEYGNYTVQAPVVTVGSAGTLEIGIYRDEADVKGGEWIVADNFRLYRVGQAVTIGEDLYATYVAPADVDFTGNEVVANAAYYDGTYVQLTPVTTVPAGTAVVIKADAAGTYPVASTTGASLGATKNELQASDGVVADGTQYILAKNSGVVGFAKATAGTTIPAGKGYLVISGHEVKSFYCFDADDATGINGVEFSEENAPIYNVAGQRLNKMQKGINIVGNKKVLK